jgi:hypothetical protein
VGFRLRATFREEAGLNNAAVITWRIMIFLLLETWLGLCMRIHSLITEFLICPDLGAQKKIGNAAKKVAINSKPKL